MRGARAFCQCDHSLCEKCCPGNSLSIAVCPQGDQLVGRHTEVYQVLLHQQTLTITTIPQW